MLEPTNPLIKFLLSSNQDLGWMAKWYTLDIVLLILLWLLDYIKAIKQCGTDQSEI